MSKVISKNNLLEVIKNLEFLENNVAQIGIWGGVEEGGGDLVKVARTHEYGSPKQNIPERSFLRKPIAKKKDKIATTLRSLLKNNLYAPNGAEKALQGVCFVAEDIVLEAFDTKGGGTWPAIKPQTVKRKRGSNAILVDTGNLRRNIKTKIALNPI